ncbi:hypothetical protein [Pseudotamlana agarivorans]|uniref:hypothetical protein n=1 Tax=Pseudotamlana agarivorans TaxID=481183 RepID=UPI00083517D2|nr:hypothetical protein [Tamlana agarivorans]
MKKENTSNTETFVKLDYKLLQRTDITLHQAIIIAHIKSYQLNNKYCIETDVEMAEKLNMSLSCIEKNLAIFSKRKMIETKSFKELGISKKQFKGRKAKVYIEEPINVEIKDGNGVAMATPKAKDVKKPISEVTKTESVKEENYVSNTDNILKEIIATTASTKSVEYDEKTLMNDVIEEIPNTIEADDLDFDNLKKYNVSKMDIEEEPSKEKNPDTSSILDLPLTTENVIKIDNELIKLGYMNKDIHYGNCERMMIIMNAKSKLQVA